MDSIQVSKSIDTTKVLKSSDSIDLKYPFKNSQAGSLFLGEPSVEII